MALKFVLGGAGTGKTHYCWEQIKTRLQEAPLGSPLIMLVPEQASFIYEKMLVSHLGVAGSIRAQVLSFQRLAHLLLSKKSLVPPVYMNEMGRTMVLSELIQKRRGQLQGLQQAAGNGEFVQEISRLFKEFQQYCVMPEQLNMENGGREEKEDKISQEFNHIFADKLKDVQLLYEDWRQFQSEGYLDHEEILTQLTEEIPQSQWLQNASIWVDSFTTFSRQEQLALIALAKRCQEVTIALCLPAELLKYQPISKQNAFYHIYQTRERLLLDAKEQGITIASDVLRKECLRYQNRPAFNHLTQGLLTYPVRRYLGGEAKEQIHLCAASDIESEIVFVARNIKRIAREENRHYRDFALITRDITRYQDVIKRVFAQVGIPVYIDGKQSLLFHPLVELIRAAFEVVVENWQTDAVLRYLKSGLAWDDKQDIDILETYVLAAGINYQRWRQKKDWTYTPNRWQEDECFSVERVNGLRKEILAPLEAFADAIKGVHTGKEFAVEIRALLEALQVDKKISCWYKQDLENGDFIQAEIHQRMMEEMSEFLQQVEAFMGEGSYRPEEILPLLEQGFREMKIAMTPPSLDGVFICDVENSRMPEVTCSFVVGLNEGFFPAKSGEDGFFSSAERDILEQHGILLGPNRDRRQYMEEYLLYIGGTRSSKQLFLSYPLADENGNPLLPTLAIGKLKELFPTITEQYFSGKAEDFKDWELLTGGQFDFAGLGNILREVKKGRRIPEFWHSVYNYYLETPLWGKEVSRMKQVLLEPGEVSYLSPSIAGKLYGKQIYSSVSRLEQFKQCPFAHFAGFGLKLKRRAKYEPGRAETGGIFHQTLAYTGKSLAKKDLSWADLSPEDAMVIAKEAVAEIAGEYWGDIAENEAKYQYLQEKLTRMIANVMTALGQQLKQGEFTPVAWELSFGEGKELPALTLDLPNGGKLIISGAIDRVDFAQKEGNAWLRVIDYKSSDKSLSLNDIFYGLKMQLLLYMQVVLSNSAVLTKGKEAGSAGIYYFTLKNAMVNALQSLNPEEAEQAWLKEFKMSGLAIKDAEAVFLADSAVDGYSSVIPVAMNKEGDFRKNSPGVTAEQMTLLQNHVLRLLQQAGSELMQGFIGVKPWKQGSFDACAYCDFKAVCGFSRDLGCSGYERLLTEEEIWQEIEKEEALDHGGKTMDKPTEGSH